MISKIAQKLKEAFKAAGNFRSFAAMDNHLLKSLLILLAITILSYEATGIFYKIIRLPLTDKSADPKSNAAANAARSTPQQNQLQDYEIITGRNLFLTTLKTAPGNQGGEFTDSDQRGADFDLKGTVASNSSFGFIVVEERGSRKQKLYRLGDKIGQGKLVRITRNTATITSGDRETTIRIKETIEGALLGGQPHSQRNDGSSRRIKLSQQAVTERLSDLRSIMNQAVVRPFLNEGVQEGFIVSNIVSKSIYEKMGLQNGDIILDVNNEPIESAGKLLLLLNSLQSGNSVNLNIKRNDNIESINYSFQ
jgi:type II secretion system protein C